MKELFKEPKIVQIPLDEEIRADDYIVRKVLISPNIIEGYGKIAGYVSSSGGAYGGDGSDGVLKVESGTTNIDAESKNVVIKNYRSIHISSGATLGLTNKASNGTILILKSQGKVTIVGKIDLEGDGANAATTGFYILDAIAHKGGTGGGGDDSGAAGSGGAIYSNKLFYSVATERIHSKTTYIGVGSGGGAGGAGEGVGGAGGAGAGGGGCLILECGGTLNFTGEINVNGNSGTNGANAGTSGAAGGGGGGGGTAGMAIVFYNRLTTNTGTINAKGGAGGDGGNTTGTGGNTRGGGGGGGGGSYSSAGKAGGKGWTSTDGEAGTNTDDASGAGGGAGAGGSVASIRYGGAGGTQGSSDSDHYLIILNTQFA